MSVEYKQYKNTYANRRVSYIKNRSEEYKFLSTPYGYPRWPRCLYQREIQHVNDFPVQKRRIAAVQHKCCHLTVTVIEQDPVECTINDIAKRSSKYQGEAENETKFKTTLYQPENKSSQDADNNDPEYCKYIRVDNLNAESHTGIFRKVDFKP